MSDGLNMAVFREALQEWQPAWGTVLGSGLGGVAERAERLGELLFSEVPELPKLRVPGHAGRFVLARIGAVPVLLAQGRAHLYEGHRAEEVTAGVRFLAECGVRRLILTNAAGTLNPAHPPGDWMMLADQINLTGASPLAGGANFVDLSEVYSGRLRAIFFRAAEQEGVTLHEGVYAGLRGPQYETPAEIRMLARLGADAVGMSTVLEAIQARALGLEVAGFSCLTNWAAGLSPGALSHAEVLETGVMAAGKFERVVGRAMAAGD